MTFEPTAICERFTPIKKGKDKAREKEREREKKKLVEIKMTEQRGEKEKRTKHSLCFLMNPRVLGNSPRIGGSTKDQNPEPARDHGNNL